MSESPIGPCLEIPWYEGTEYVPVHPDGERPDPFYTVESWTDASSGDDRWVEYHPTCELTSRKDAQKITYVLRYRPDDHPDMTEDDDGRWGVSTITIDLLTWRATAKWEDDLDPRKWNGSVDAHLIDKQPRTRGISRPILRNQAQLRSLLLGVYGKCAITGETTASALDVAHIVSVEQGGTENWSNALLLRADLHRLYDAGDFRVNTRGRIVGLSPGLSSSYRDILTGTRLDGKIVKRVKNALHKRQSRMGD